MKTIDKRPEKCYHNVKLCEEDFTLKKKYTDADIEIIVITSDLIMSSTDPGLDDIHWVD